MEKYIKPNMEIVEFDVEDIIETSINNNGETQNKTVFNDWNDSEDKYLSPTSSNNAQ